MTSDGHPKKHVECVDVTGGTQPECDNTPFGRFALSVPVIAKIPVVLTGLIVRISVDAMITLPEPALEIKQVKKRLKLTQCLLLPSFTFPVTDPDTFVLFLKGFVRKNIDFSTRDCSNKKGFCGDIKQCTVDIPFSCTTLVDFPGVLPEPVFQIRATEFEYSKAQDLPPQFAEKDQLLSGDLSEFNQFSSEFLNERPFCELVSSSITEFDEFLNRRRPDDVKLPFEEKEFIQIEEKMVISLQISVLQNRLVRVGGATGTQSTANEG